jgi:hypothetical protein
MLVSRPDQTQIDRVAEWMETGRCRQQSDAGDAS